MAGSQLVMASKTIFWLAAKFAYHESAPKCCELRMVAVATPFWLAMGISRSSALRACTWPSPFPASSTSNAPRCPVDLELGLGIDESQLNALEVNIQPRDAMG